MTNINTNGEMLKRQQCVLRKNVLLLIFEFSMYIGCTGHVSNSDNKR